MTKPHLLHVELRTGLHLRFECPNADLGAARPCATHYENMAPRPDEPGVIPGTIGTLRHDGDPVFVIYDNDERTNVPMTPEQAEEWTAFWKAEDEYEAFIPSDECWVEHHVLECVYEGISIEDFLEELGDYGPITGPIPVKVWNEGDFEECIPRMEIWKPPKVTPEVAKALSEVLGLDKALGLQDD